MSEQTTHPSSEELSAFSLGQLPPDAAVAVESHISECQPCCDTLLGLSSDDTFVGLLQEAEQLPPDQTVDHGLSAPQSSSSQDVPSPLAEHPRYEVLRLIGKGGMGDVYKARHRKMERTVALKVINRGLVRKAEAIDRFHREVKAAAQLSHPNIVTAYDADQAGEFHFMVMEFVDGVDLSHIVKDQGAMRVADACDYIRQAAIGLQHAHECGMVHRDIKPHNLMVTKDGSVKILDFGLASLAPESLLDADTVEACSDLTAAGAIMGTPDFISPEQAEDARQADIRSDIYSLGATLYFLLSGRVPFAEGSVMHKLKSHTHIEPDSLESLRDDVPAELVAIVSRMMAKSPSERFQTPAEVVEALETLGKETEPTKSRESVLQVQPRRRRIGWIPLTAIATIFLAVILAGIVYYIETNSGIVRVEVADDSLAVEISGQTITVGDGNKQPLEIRAGDCVLKVRQGDFQFETDRFQIRRGNEVAFKVEMLEGEIVVRKDGERFHSKALSDEIEVRQILDRMVKAYAECKSYRDSGVIKAVISTKHDYPMEYSFNTAFVSPDRFRFEIKNEVSRLLISANGQNVQTWFDADPGIIQKPKSLELAMAQAAGFSAGDVSRIPAMLMPQKLETSGGLTLIDPKQIEDGKLQDVECFRLEYNFRDEQFTLWIDKRSYLVRRIDERIKLDGIRVERTTTYDPKIDGIISDKMLEFLPEGDLKQLQGDWDVMAFTQDGKTEFAADKGVSMLIQIKGDTITRIQTRPNGEKSEKEWGRIELNSKSNPKSIDIVNPDGPGGRLGRLLGIYALKDGALKICFSERSDINVAEGKPAKRPTTFDAPAGSELVLLECRRKRSDVDTDTSDDFEREAAKWVLDNGGVVVLKNTAGRSESVEKVDDLPTRQFTITHIGLKDVETLIDEDLKRLEGLHLSTLTLTGTQVTDTGLAYLKRVPQLDYLVLDDCPRISLSDVSGLRHVKALSLRGTPALSKDVWKNLEELPNLSQLDIGENRQFTDQALVHVEKLKKLTLLVLDSTDLSDAGLQHLASLNELYTLNLASTAITDAGLKHLAKLDALFDLDLTSTAISDDGLKHLTPLDLYALNLDSTAITDAGLKHLESHEGLRKLSLNGTGVTAQGVQKLREALSEECQINWKLRTDDRASDIISDRKSVPR